MAPMDTDSPGRSGARFMTSYDRMYVVKTIMSEEVAEMHRILKEYHQVPNDDHTHTHIHTHILHVLRWVTD